MTQKVTEPISKDRVISVYSGKANTCCCGCAGKHSYREDPELRALASKWRGYPVQDDEVSERSVSFVINKINKNLEHAEDGGNHWSFETPTRIYIAYKIEDCIEDCKE